MTISIPFCLPAVTRACAGVVILLLLSFALEQDSPSTTLAGDLQEPPVVGDVNCDEIVDATDSLAILRMVAGLDGGLACVEAGDVNCDGEVDTLDALEILRHVAGLPPGKVPGDCPPIGSPAGLPPLEFVVDPGLEPWREFLATELDGEPRPVSALEDDDGVQSMFVANELILATDDLEALDNFLERWSGHLIETLDTSEVTLLEEPLPLIHLVRIDSSAADPERLAEDLRAFAADSWGQFRVSSDAGLHLLAAAAQEGVDGIGASPNWVLEGGFDQRRTSEHPTGGGPWSSNAWDWPYMSRGSIQDTGVADAWRALKAAGRLNNKVRITILDGGFAPNTDFPTGYKMIGGANVPNPATCTGGSHCPWHGTTVTAALAGTPDDNFGVAGPAGPVAEVTLMQSPDADLFSYLKYIFIDLPRGVIGTNPHIMNISAGVAIPRELCLVPPFICSLMDTVAASLRAANILVFAAAMNDGRDVDDERCVWFVCYEKRRHVPCELSGVVCVGGLAWDSNLRHSGSNWGSKDAGNSVDIFGPYEQFTTPTPNQLIPARERCGTSCATPFVAGVAALIKAANPSLSAGGIVNLLMTHAHTGSPDSTVPRWVNAYGSVIAALGGNEPPEVTITSPGDGLQILAGAPFSLSANATDPEDRPTLANPWTGLPSLEWIVFPEGVQSYVAGSVPSLQITLNTIGQHVLRVTATDSQGWQIHDHVTIEVVNVPPQVQITSPLDGSTFFENEAILFRSFSIDPNEPGSKLSNAQMEWVRRPLGQGPEPAPDGDIFTQPVGTGHELHATLPLGSHLVTLIGTDSHGAFASESIVVIVEEPPDDLPPSVTITSPPSGYMMGCAETVTLVGQAIDPEDGTLTGSSLVWTLNHNGTTTIGTGQQVDFQFATTEGFANFIVTLTATDSGGNVRSDTIAMSYGCLN